MLTKIAQCVLLTSLSFSVLAKAPHVLCLDAPPLDFVRGDGSKSNPYLVCTALQLTRLVTELPLLEKSYRLGTDINFENFPFPIIGTPTTPFTGTFDGNGYTLSSISLDISRSDYIAPFAYVNNGKIENLFINGITSKVGSRVVGGVVGRAENTSIVNVHVTGLNMPAPDQSGGLVGELVNGFVFNCSTEGTLINRFGTDGSGGLVGSAINSDISSCSSKVDMTAEAAITNGASAIGGLVGSLINSRVKDVYAVGDINYSNVNATGSQGLGGLVGAMRDSLLERAYYAGKIVAVNAQNVGGAVGAAVNSFTENLFWDRQVSGVAVSAVGEGKKTSALKKKTFWVSRDFDQHLWKIVGGKYPTLFGADGA